ncbi:MAG: hypothetical protein J2P45_23480 [Candidatus Dormibacteraeota bacterium]|nr:hypothetical protein [Candidatus Dormibacteraeota bacterium]
MVASALALVLIALLAVTGSLYFTGRIGPQSSSGVAATPTPATSAPSSSPSVPATAPAQPTSPAALTGFAAAPVSGGSAAVPAVQSQLAAVRAGTHAGYDRFVIDLGQTPVQAYVVTSQTTAAFTLDPSGQAVQLDGSSGVVIVLHDTIGRWNNGSYAGPTDLHPGLPAIREARQIGDFEGVLTWALGINGPGYLRVQTLSGPSRLVVDVQS